MGISLGGDISKYESLQACISQAGDISRCGPSLSGDISRFGSSLFGGYVQVWTISRWAYLQVWTITWDVSGVDLSRWGYLQVWIISYWWISPGVDHHSVGLSPGVDNHLGCLRCAYLQVGISPGGNLSGWRLTRYGYLHVKYLRVGTISWWGYLQLGAISWNISSCCGYLQVGISSGRNRSRWGFQR